MQTPSVSHTLDSSLSEGAKATTRREFAEMLRQRIVPSPSSPYGDATSPEGRGKKIARGNLEKDSSLRSE